MKNTKGRIQLLEALGILRKEGITWLCIDVKDKVEWTSVEIQSARLGVYWRGETELDHHTHRNGRLLYITTSMSPMLLEGRKRDNKARVRRHRDVSFKNFVNGRYLSFTKIYVVSKGEKKLLVEY